MQQQTWFIPDPRTQPEFYSDVPLKRLVAWVIDTVVTFALCLVVIFFTAFMGTIFLPFLMVIVGFIYRVATLSHKSATWGMRVMAIEFRTLSGQRLDPTLAFLHTSGLVLSFALSPIQLVSIFFMLTSDRGQGLTDRILGTVAVNRAAGA